MVPIIDFRNSTVEKQMHAAYTTCGFAVFTNVFDSWLSEFLDWQQLVEEFFNLSDVKKQSIHTAVLPTILAIAA